MGNITEISVLICPYCAHPAQWVQNKEVYGQNYGKSYMIWLCKDCDAYVGCHMNTKQPLGTMANRELRDWRKKAHAAFDPIWLYTGKKERYQAYQWLTKQLGLTQQVHIGEADIETCQRIIRVSWDRRNQMK